VKSFSALAPEMIDEAMQEIAEQEAMAPLLV
jgi:hypothetical protein